MRCCLFFFPFLLLFFFPLDLPLCDFEKLGNVEKKIKEVVLKRNFKNSLFFILIFS